MVGPDGEPARGGGRARDREYRSVLQRAPRRAHDLAGPLSAEYGAYRGGPVPAPVRGDYRVVLPAGERDVTEQYLASLRANYRLVFATHSPFAVPAYDAKTLVKEALAGRLTADQRTRQGLVVSENALERPDFYVFVHK
jgi:hypothetical protein